MSKSLGNVLDPFAVIERFGADALRFYLLRDVPFGQDGSVSTASFELRYETELANELGNLASRTHRDAAPLPRRRGAAGGARSGRSPRTSTGLAARVAEHIDRAELTLALDEIWQRVRRLNRYVEEQAPWQLAKDDSAAGELDVVLATLAEGLRCVDRAAVALPAREHRAAARGARCAGALAGDGRARRRARSRASGRSRRCSRRTLPAAAARDRLAHPPRPLRAAGHRARRGRRGGGRAAHAHGRDRRRLLPRGARGGRGLPAGLRGDRAPPERRARLRRRRPRRAARARRARALRGDRRDGPRLLPRRRAAGRSAARLRGADRAGPRDRQAAGDPHARRRGRHARAARLPKRRG